VHVALFVPCLVDGLFPGAGRATATVLDRVGARVAVPRAQTCCGQMHINAGYPRHAVDLVRNSVAAFAGFDAVVSPSASCVGSMRHQHAEVARLVGDDLLAQQADELAGRCYELSEFLVDVLHVDDVGARFPHRVAYHPTCHSLRLLRLGERPLRLLGRVRDLELAELPDAETCCGFGGTFALKNAETSTAMLADKLAAIAASGARFVAASDVSCLMHIGGGLSRASSAIRPVHVAEILACT
jgi:L-lactate dehydrogenase complex protein LldE